jgi:hypothetical protein
VIAPTPASAMSLTELFFFTDNPGAQRAAYLDFQRARQIEQRDAEIAEYIESRRDHLIAQFVTEVYA